MESDQNLNSQEDRKWDYAWTTDDIRKNSANWTLAGDVGLYNHLTDFAQNLISRTHEVQNAVDALAYRTKMANSKITNVINDFHMLSNLQFVENRVYDEEIQETPVAKPVEKTKEQKEAEMLPKIIQAIELGMQVLDQKFNKIHVDEISDSDDEDLSSEGRIILEAKDPYEQHILPFIIGSEEFNKCDYAGLRDLLEEDADYSVEVESGGASDSEETSSDEDPLPIDDEEDDKFRVPISQNQLKSDRFSSSEESELFGSEKDEAGFISDSSLDSRATGKNNIQKGEEGNNTTDGKVSRQSSVSTVKSKLNLAHVLPVAKMNEKKKESEDLFANEEDISDEESPFRKGTGLFTSDLKFSNEKDMFDGGLFGEETKESRKVDNAPAQTTTKRTTSIVSKKNDSDLFGTDEDSDEDIFNTLAKTKVPETTKPGSSYKRIGTALPGLTSIKPKELPFEDTVDKVSWTDSPNKGGDSSSTPSSEVSIRQSANSFGLGGGGGSGNLLFGDESDGEDLFSTKKMQPRKSFDFAAESEDDLFAFSSTSNSKKQQVVTEGKITANMEENNTSLFGEVEKIDKMQSIKRMGTALPGLTSAKSNGSLTLDAKPDIKKTGQPLPVPKKTKDSLFDDGDDSEQELSLPNASIAESKKKSISLFDDDDDADDDIFSTAIPKKLMSPGESPSLTHKADKSQFSKFQNPGEVGSLAPSEKEEVSSSLFAKHDDFEQSLVTRVPAVASQSKSKDLSLFEGSDNFDLFHPKTEEKLQKKTESPTKVDLSIDPKRESDVKIPEAKKPASQVLDSEVSSISFDAPPDSTKTLNALSKDRAKISTKRRKPTKQGRRAVLESDLQNVTIPDTVTAALPTSNASAENRLHTPPKEQSAPPTTTTHKAQEKKKMNLMSQLMSEVATTKIAKKLQAEEEEEEEEEEDIFAEVGKRERSKSSFSFQAPIESKVPDKEEGEKSKVTSDDEDDFFAEPSFRNFRSSISHKNSLLNMEEEDDEDDLFSVAKTTALPKPKAQTDESDIFAVDDGDDIFADVQKEKYEMFPSHVYDDDDDDNDIFSSLGTKPSTKLPTAVPPAKKEAEKKPVNVFEDPLTGLLGTD